MTLDVIRKWETPRLLIMQNGPEVRDADVFTHGHIEAGENLHT